ncbi:MAG: substrate-binding domain-containing protein [Acidimicrobiales bacterium]
MLGRFDFARPRARSVTSRRGFKIVAATLFASASALLLGALPAGAVNTPAENNVIIGSGSQAAYSTLQSLENLFNLAPGCTLYVPQPNSTNPQEENFACATPPTTAANPENPYGDVATEEPPLGSNTGISELENSGAHGATATNSGASINVFQGINFATSSRAIGTSDLKGLNFVAYAEDGVTWFNYTEVANVATPSSAVTNLSQAQLEDIYNGTYTNWDQVGGADAPIVVFSAQEGAGVQSVFKTFLGFDPSLSTNKVNCYTPSGGTNTCVGPAVIGQNEDKQIATTAFGGTQKPFVGDKNPDWGGSSANNNEIESDAIYFFSYGDYTASCKGNVKNCGGSPLATGTTNAVESINGVAPNEQTILDGQFPVDHYLFNVYSDGSNANIPAATAATLNFASEIGFICNPNKGSSTAIKDPATGKTYLSEIQTDIENAGFYPLSAGAADGTVNQTPMDEGMVTNPASQLLDETTGGQGAGQPSTDPGYAQYKPYDTFAPTGPNNDPSGYCLTSTTDNNASS